MCVRVCVHVCVRVCRCEGSAAGVPADHGRASRWRSGRGPGAARALCRGGSAGEPRDVTVVTVSSSPHLGLSRRC